MVKEGAERSDNSTRESLVATLKKDGIIPPESNPTIEVTFDFGSHGTLEDAERLTDLVSTSDIILMEHAGWQTNPANFFHACGKGEYSSSEIDSRAIRGPDQFFKGVALQLVRKFEKTNEPTLVYPMDLPSSMLDIKEFSNLHLMFENSRVITGQKRPPTFSVAVEAHAKLFKEYVTQHARREQYAVDNFANTIRIALRNDPEIAKKPVIRVGIIYGGAHTSLQKQLQNQVPEIHVGRRPFTTYFSYQHEIVRSILWGVRPSQELFNKSFYEYIGRPSVDEVAKLLPLKARSVYFRAVAEALTGEEWKLYYDMLTQADDDRVAKAYLFKLLEERGVPTKKDPKILEEFYKKKTFST